MDLTGANAGAARELDELRLNWLNPPEWTREEVLEFPGSVAAPWHRNVHDLDSRAISTVRYSRPCRRTTSARSNFRLDAAVFAAYGWPENLTDDEILETLLTLNLKRESVTC